MKYLDSPLSEKGLSEVGKISAQSFALGSTGRCSLLLADSSRMQWYTDIPKKEGKKTCFLVVFGNQLIVTPYQDMRTRKIVVNSRMVKGRYNSLQFHIVQLGHCYILAGCNHLGKSWSLCWRPSIYILRNCLVMVKTNGWTNARASADCWPNWLMDS